MNGRIFIIEDEPSIIQLVQHNLEKNGFIVSSSINGNDGLKELKKTYTIVIVTHSMAQAVRVSQKTGFFHLGKLIEVGKTEKIFKS